MDNQRVKKKKKIFVALNFIKIIIKLLNKKRKSSKKKYWVRPMLLQRKSKGHFNNLFQEKEISNLYSFANRIR